MSNEEKARFNYENYRYCFDNGHQQWLVVAARCFDFWNNKQWSDADRAKLTRAGRPALTFNIIEAMTRAAKGMQRALRNDVRFQPTSPDAIEGAHVRDAVWMQVQTQNKLDFLESDVYMRGYITGRAYYDTRVDFDDSLQGTVRITTPRSQDVILDPSILDYDPRTWPQVFTRRWTNLLDIRNLFGRAAADELEKRGTPSWTEIDDDIMGRTLSELPFYAYGYSPGQIDNKLVRAFMLIDRQYLVLKTKECFVDTRTGDFSEIPENWDRERIKKVLDTVPGLATMRRSVKTVRWTVSCNDVLLHDEDSPYDRFTITPFFPNFLDGITQSSVEPLLDPQMLYNKVTSQELHIINTTANSGWVSKVGNIKNYTAQQLEEQGAKTGIVLEVEDVAQTVKVQPNSVPSGHDRLSFKADKLMRDIAGMPDGARGFAREDVANEAIMTNQAAADINFAGPLGNLHRSKQLLAENVESCVRTYYTETRVIMINRGTTYRPEYDMLTINQPTAEGEVLNDITQGKYTTTLIPAPSRASLSEGEFEALVKLRREVGIQIPDDIMIELAPIADKLKVIQAIKGDSNSAQQQLAAAEQRNAELEAQLTQAKTEKEQAAAALNEARANKAQIEAERDPDASYERVETHRIETEAAIAREQLASKERMDSQKLGVQRRTADRNTAVALTKIQADTAKNTQNNIAKIASVKHAPPKPAPTVKKPTKPKKPAGAK